MSGRNRATQIEKLHKTLKKHYEVPPSQPSRPLLEHVLYASLLEDCPAELADEGMAKCEQDFFDWNEVRVTTVSELAQVLGRLPEPNRAAARLKGNLQSIFEEFYTFDLDHLKKENLGKAVKKFADMPTMSSFVLGYTIQHGLGGHSIPLDYSAMVVLLITGIAAQGEASVGKVPGLERAVPKNKGIEFSALLHQCAVALHEDPKDKLSLKVVESVNKEAGKELQAWLSNKKEARKRAAVRKAEEKEAARLKAKEDAQAAREAAAQAAAKKAAASSRRAAAKKAAGPTAAEQAAAEQAAAAKKAARESKAKAKSAKSKGAAAKSSPSKSKPKTSPPKTAAKPKSAKKPSAKKSSPPKPAKKSTPSAKPTAKKPTSKKPAPKKNAAKKPVSKKKTAKKPVSKKTAAKPKPASKKSAPKKSGSRKLSKRKPR
ncbi:MAG: hypothetical protein AAF989_03300 [Planctomycetota bacterium]